MTQRIFGSMLVLVTSKTTPFSNGCRLDIAHALVLVTSKTTPFSNNITARYLTVTVLVTSKTTPFSNREMASRATGRSLSYL